MGKRRPFVAGKVFTLRLKKMFLPEPVPAQVVPVLDPGSFLMAML